MASLQRALAARGLYGGAVDGLAGPELDLSDLASLDETTRMMTEAGLL